MRCLSHFYNEICRILMRFNFTCKMISQIHWYFSYFTLIYLSSIMKQQNSIKTIKDIRRWLMNSANNCHVSIFRFLLKHFYNFQRCCAIKPTCWLITQYDLRVCNKLITYARSLSLSS